MINQYLIYALIIGFFIGGVAGYVGSLMVTKKMSLMGGALGHLTLPGISLALLYDFDPSLGASLFLITGIIIIWLLHQTTKLSLESLTAVVFSSFLSTAFLFLPKDKTLPALIGDISKISTIHVIIIGTLSCLIFVILKSIYNKIMLINISKDVAKSLNINIAKYNFLYLFCIGIIIVLGVRIVGGLMTAALVAIPATTSKNISRTLKQYSYFSLFFGALSCLLGISVAEHYHLPPGPFIILSSSILFLISISLGKKITTA